MTGLELKEKRENAGFTQQKLADLLNVTRKTINSYENGGNIPPSKVTLIEHVLPNNVTPKKNDVVLIDSDEEIEVFKNKNGINFFLYPDDLIKIEVFVLPFEAYASSQIECYFDEDYTNKELHKTQFTVDKIGKGVYLGFKTKNDSMNGGGIFDTPSKAEVLGREIGRQHWLSLHKNDYGFILMTKSSIIHKDITNYNELTGMFTLHSRNPLEKDFEISVNDIYRIFNVIKRTF
jgi:transcriptional regulator with XRE-family HTH domain